MTATVREAIIGIVIAFIQTIAERSTRKDTKDENENCDFEVRHLQNQGCVDQSEFSLHHNHQQVDLLRKAVAKARFADGHEPKENFLWTWIVNEYNTLHYIYRFVVSLNTS